MRRTIPILSGLAILAVIINHSNYHILGEIAPGAGNLLAALPYLLLDQTNKFAVPAFVFIAGYFISYATWDGRKELKWAIVQARILGLVWPWLVWSAVLFLEQVYKGDEINVVNFLRTMLIQYYFVPLLIFYYLTSIPMVRWAKENPKRLLVAVGAVQLAIDLIYEARIYWHGFPPALYGWMDVGVLNYLRYAVYFPLGVTAGMYIQQVRGLLAPYKRSLPWIVLAAYAVESAEAAHAFALGAGFFPQGADQTRLTSALFSLSLLVTFMAYERIPVPLAKQLTYLGTHSFGLYLSHYALLGAVTWTTRLLVPVVWEYWGLAFMLLFGVTLTAAVLIMEAAKRLPIRQFYRVVFG